jgi:hypothetical protein
MSSCRSDRDDPLAVIVRLSVVLLAACGRLDFDPSSTIDAITGDTMIEETCATRVFSNPAASSIQDDFATGVLTDRWAAIGGCIAQSAGDLVAVPTDTGAYCFAATLVTTHLSCDAIVMRVPEVTAPVLGAQTFIYVSPATSDENMHMILEGDGYQLGTNTNGIIVGSADVRDPVNDVWWRLSAIDGEVVFDTSPDGVAWRERLRGPEPFSFDDVYVSLGAGTWMPTPSPGQARFGCYNVSPPCP